MSVRGPGEQDAVVAEAEQYRRQALELARVHGRMFVGLRGHLPDRNLFAYVPVELAVHELVLPLVLDGNTLRVAAASVDPDLSVVRARYPHLHLELVCAPADEIDAALDQVTAR